MYSFRWISSYMGRIEYEVLGDGLQSYRVQVRTDADAYERSIFNGDEAEWQRDVIGEIGRVRRASGSDPSKPIPADVIAAFNAWRLADHEAWVKRLRSEPRRYGEIQDDDPLLQPPAAVEGVHYVIDTGWVS